MVSSSRVTSSLPRRRPDFDGQKTSTARHLDPSWDVAQVDYLRPSPERKKTLRCGRAQEQDRWWKEDPHRTEGLIIMRRKTLDALLASTGAVIALVLLAAGGLLTWTNSYIDSQVSDQLTMQDITMPAKDALETEAQHDALDQYAGQRMSDGDQAKAFADHYILVHMNASSDGRTYEEVSGEFLAKTGADPEFAATEEGQQLAQLRQSLFMGNTLRGLLLNAYAFDTMGEIAGYAAWASFGGAAVLLVLTGAGFVHMRRTPEDAAVGSGHSDPVAAGV
jgi:hypothetical protein